MNAVIQFTKECAHDTSTKCPSCGQEVFRDHHEIVDLDAGAMPLCNECSPDDLWIILEAYDSWWALETLTKAADLTIKKNLVKRRGKKNRCTYSVCANRPDGQIIVATSDLLVEAVGDAAHQCERLDGDDEDGSCEEEEEA